MEFNVGDVVLLQLGVDAKFAPKGLKRWDGCQFVISKVTVRKQSLTNRVALYELSTCKSAEGNPVHDNGRLDRANEVIDEQSIYGGKQR